MCVKEQFAKTDWTIHVHHCVTNIFTDLAKNFQIVFHMYNMLYLTEADKDTAMAAIGPQGTRP